MSNMTSNISSPRPFFLNFFAAFRSSYKSTSPPFSSNHIQSARAIATKAANSQSQQSSRSQTQVPNQSTSHTGPAANSQSSHYHTEQSSSSNRSNPIPINTPDRQRRGSASSSGSAGFGDAIGSEKWYIGGRTPAGDERFYRLGMVTQGGGRLGGSGRVGSIDQLSL